MQLLGHRGRAPCTPACCRQLLHCSCAAATKLRPWPALPLWAVAAGVRLCSKRGLHFHVFCVQGRGPIGLVNHSRCAAKTCPSIVCLAAGSQAVECMSDTGLFHRAPGLCCRRRAVVRLGRKRSDELYAKFTNFPQDDDDKRTYANDTVGSLSLHGHLQRPCQPWSAAECMPLMI